FQYPLQADALASSSRNKSKIEVPLYYIRVDDMFTELRLTRYYRSDWQGIATSFFQSSVHTYTLDCRTVGADNVQSVFEAIRSMARGQNE
ncbi:MAG: hypothetical protein WAO78_18510, partial [Roseovarius sp.]